MKIQPKKSRGIRKPKGYTPGSIAKNLHTAWKEHIPGNEIVTDGALRFFDSCRSFSKILGMAIKHDDHGLEVEFNGLNKPLLKIYRLRKKDIYRNAHWLAVETCARVLWAIEKRNGRFFTDLARLCESPEGKIGLREWLILAHWDLWKGTQNSRPQDHHYTVSELCKKAIKRGVVTQISDRDMYPLLKQLGIKYLPSKRGPKQFGKISN